MKQGLIVEDAVRIFGELLCAQHTEEIKTLVDSMIPRDVSYGCIISKEGSSAWAQQSMSKFRRAEIETIAHGVTETEAIGICHSEDNFRRGLAKSDIVEKDFFSTHILQSVNSFVCSSLSTLKDEQT